MLELKNGAVIAILDKFETTEDVLKIAEEFAPEASGEIEVFIKNDSIGMLTVRDSEGMIFDYIGKVGEVILEPGSDEGIAATRASNFTKLGIENPKIHWKNLKSAPTGFAIFNNGKSKLRKFSKD